VCGASGWTLGILRDLQAVFWLRVFLLPSFIYARPSAMLRERKPLARPRTKESSILSQMKNCEITTNISN